MKKGLESCVCLNNEAADFDFSGSSPEAKTLVVDSEQRIKNLEEYIRGLEIKFKKIFGHKIKSLGLEKVSCPVALRLIMKECVRNYSGHQKEYVPKPHEDPILKKVPGKERLLCEGILVDLHIAYKTLENLRKNT